MKFYREMMEHFQSESASKSARLAAMAEENRILREEIAAIAESHRGDMERLRTHYDVEMEKLRATHREEMEKLRASHREAVDRLQASMDRTVARMAEANASLSAEIKDALNAGKLARKKRFGRSSEQKDLLNNRREVSRQGEEEDSDGTPPEDGRQGGGSVDRAGQDGSQEKSRLKKRRVRKPEGKMRFDRIIDHTVEDMAEIPEGARFLPGEKTFTFVRHIPASTECHVYHFRRFIVESGDDRDVFGYTLPQEIRSLRPLPSCPLSPELLGFIMAQKYGYYQPQDRIRAMLADMGVHIPKKTFNRYFLGAAGLLGKMLGDVYREEMRKGDYFMIDETTVTVGVVDDPDRPEKKRQYRDRYMWEFYNRTAGLVEYLYEDGSRGQKVLLEFFGKESPLPGTVISCDGYNAYRLFDDREKYGDVIVVGCWTHARRKFVDALECCRPQCMDMLADIGRLFGIEAECAELGYDADRRLSERKRRSRPILDSIKAAADRMWEDTGLMAVNLLKKAVGYLRNQWDHLYNIVRTGVAEISNNYSEQIVKPVKLTQKNSLNIGSEPAASTHAFMYSLAESCRRNSVNIQEYLTMLFRKARLKLTGPELVALLPNNNPLKC